MQEQQSQECSFYMDGLLKQNLTIVKQKIRDDWDFIFVVDGVEGGGKSVFAQQIAKYCDSSFNIDRVCFTADGFKEKVINAKKYQAIVYDEAYQGLSSRASMSHTNKSIVSMLAEIRQKNLFVFIVLPTFFDLDKNVALWRSRGLFHIYLGKNFERGYFRFYNYITKKFLYVNGKKTYNYQCVKPNLKGRFGKTYAVDEKAYKKMKAETLTRYTEQEEDKESSKVQKLMQQRTKLVQLLSKFMTKTKISEEIGVHRHTVGSWSVDSANQHSLT